MNNFVKIIIIFLAITGLATVAMNLFHLDFGIYNYWNKHGVFFLIFITLFPRLTLLLSSVPFGGLFWWLGWLFTPRLLVAILATIAYWNTNEVLVVLSWLVAWGGESSEKFVVHRRTRKTFRGRTIEAEFTVKNPDK